MHKIFEDFFDDIETGDLVQDNSNADIKSPGHYDYKFQIGVICEEKDVQKLTNRYRYITQSYNWFDDITDIEVEHKHYDTSNVGLHIFSFMFRGKIDTVNNFIKFLKIIVNSDSNENNFITIIPISKDKIIDGFNYNITFENLKDMLNAASQIYLTRGLIDQGAEFINRMLDYGKMSEVFKKLYKSEYVSVLGLNPSVAVSRTSQLYKKDVVVPKKIMQTKQWRKASSLASQMLHTPITADFINYSSRHSLTNVNVDYYFVMTKNFKERLSDIDTDHKTVLESMLTWLNNSEHKADVYKVCNFNNKKADYITIVLKDSNVVSFTPNDYICPKEFTITFTVVLSGKPIDHTVYDFVEVFGINRTELYKNANNLTDE